MSCGECTLASSVPTPAYRNVSGRTPTPLMRAYVRVRMGVRAMSRLTRENGMVGMSRRVSR
jgi:hypothetical protein